MDLIDILTLLGIIMAGMSVVVALIVFLQFTRQALKGVKPLIKHPIPKRKIIKKEIPMSKEAKEGVTFNDIFMFMIAVPLVLLWVGFAGFVIHTGLGNAAVLENIEAYTTLIAILGGPALLIIKDALDVWKQEQAEKTAFYKVKAQAVIDYNDTVLKQAQDIESKAQEQEHKMESKK
jgi:hypothetical protein